MAIILPKNIAEAIEHTRAKNPGHDRLNEYGIMKYLQRVDKYGDFPGLRTLDAYFNDPDESSDRHPNVLMNALVNGYETELEPEERIRALLAMYSDEYNEYDNGFHHGMKSALKTYGITIEGVTD